ncbi:MAG: fused MFS/spermidine synthase [Pseudomonadota bacterium]|nr:fused MFS/spermidine synthase [Pseudomonadota bacterium]
MKSKIVLVLFFLSGSVTLVYEVFWMKELGLLFGNTAFSTATTLAVFFFGLATGGYYWGRRSSRIRNPLQTYGLLELAIAVSVIGYFYVLDIYYVMYPHLYGRFGDSRLILVSIKFLLSFTLLFPASFFIGGTLPLMTHYFSDTINRPGKTLSLLYAVNTLGAAIGALLAGFFLPNWFGFSLSYRGAIGCSLLIGCMALVLAYRGTPGEAGIRCVVGKITPDTGCERLPASTIWLLSALSGFGTLSLQVLWTRMFAQVLQNSVYTFASILFVFLIFLALGAALANRIIDRYSDVLNALFLVLVTGALAVSATPFLFHYSTDGLHFVSSQLGWNEYLLRVLSLEFTVMGLPLILLGAIFPLLVRIAEPMQAVPGRLVGQLVCVNTVGAIGGSLISGFVIFQTVGAWAGIGLVGVSYLVGAIYLVHGLEKTNRPSMLIPMAIILLLVLALDPTSLPRVRIDPDPNRESLLRVWESGSGTVAVVRQGDALKIKVNNYYTLGGSGSRELEEVEAYLPLLAHSRPKSVFFLGLGSGISAGAVLRFPVERLVVAELIADVVTASEEYFGDFNNGLFVDPRAIIVAEDGRSFLAASSEKFDLVIADLFVPWRSGVGSLYTVEHYLNVRGSLETEGLFMQWLPAYQLSFREFGSIVRTMLNVFPQVTLWRGDFSSRKPVLGLLAGNIRKPLQPDAMLFSTAAPKRIGREVPVLSHYIGNMGLLSDEFEGFPVNHEDKPVIEYQAPVTQLRQQSGEVTWMVGRNLLDFMERIRDRQPSGIDSYLVDVPARHNQLPEAGMELYRSQVLNSEGYRSAAKEAYARYLAMAKQDSP